MRSNYLKAAFEAAILAVTILLLTAGISSAQTVVNLTASQQTTVLPDGNTVPMWGWTCGDALATPVASVGATCTALTYNTAGAHPLQTGGTTWQPPLIVVPSAAAGASLTISFTNSLPVETSIVIIGQVNASTTANNGGLGTPARELTPRTDGDHSPGIDHTPPQCTSLTPTPTPVGCNTNFGNPLPGQTATTWTTVTSSNFTPPTQGERVRSFVPEVAGIATVGATPTTLAYSWTGLKPGTYLIRTGTYPSIQGPMGLYGVLVVTQLPVTGAPGLAYPVPPSSTTTGVMYDADVVALESEMDPRQNKAVAALFTTGVANSGFSETAKWNPGCGAGVNGLTSSGTAPTCYPPAVDYTPLYFVINGLAFSKDNRQASALSIPAAANTGNVLVRYVNAGSHMHVPTVVGLNMLLVAEDGYVLPDVALALTKGKTLTANTATPPTGSAQGLQIRNEVFQAAGKVFDVIVSPTQTVAGTYDSSTYATFDRSLALGTNSQRDGGMQAVLDVNDTGVGPANKLFAANSVAIANPDKYAYAPGVTLTVSNPGKGVIANDVNVYGVKLVAQPANGMVNLNPNGTFTYTPNSGFSGTDTFQYFANGNLSTVNTTLTAMVTLSMSGTANSANAPHANDDTYTSKVASLLRVGAPGVLVNDTDPNGYPLKASPTISTMMGLTSVTLNPDGGFTAIPALCAVPTGCRVSFVYNAVNSQNIPSNTALVTLTFLTGSGLNVMVQDAATKAAITDYKWIIEQDLTLHIDPACQVNGTNAQKPATCPAGVPPTPATQFHTSFYPVIATGCTGPQSCGQGQTIYDANKFLADGTTPNPTYGQHVQAVCDGYGICTVGGPLLKSFPADANLTATNPDGSAASYYISILSGDSTNPFNTGNVKDPSGSAPGTGNCAPGTEATGIAISSSCGHTMGGSPIHAPVNGGFAPVTVNLELAPLKTATVTAFIFEDDWPLNGEPDTGGGVDTLATLEVPLGDFAIEIWDTAGGIGDFTGQMTFDTFNFPLTNALNGTIDPNTGFDACPISNTAGVAVGVVIVCPLYEAGVDASGNPVPSPLTGQVVVRNLMQGKYALIAHPGAAREAAGEEWLQTNSLDGGHFLDSFIRVGEPPYFAEFGPGGYHVFFGFANPKHINARLAAICAGSTSLQIPFALPCRNNINGQVTNLHQSRSPNEQLYSGAVFPPVPASVTTPPTDCSATPTPTNCKGAAGNYASLSYTNCYAALGDPDGATIALAKCDADGNFKFTNLPDGNYGIVIFDQWDDFIVDGSSRPANVTGGQTLNLILPTFTWQTHLWNRAYMDTQGLGTPVLDAHGNLDPVLSPGLIQIPTRIRQRNGKIVSTSLSDIGGNTQFNEVFPLFAWYTVESDTTRFRGTGVHVVNDAGGQVDGPVSGGGNGNTGPYQGILNSKESFPLPPALSVPGAVYCAANDAACNLTNLISNPTGLPSGPGVSTARIDPGNVTVEGWQGGVSEFNMMDWGKTPYIPGENGGIIGHVVYQSTRPFDDPRMNSQNLWDPLVPNVTINLYREGTAPDGTTSLILVDTTQTSSWDAWAQGFHNVTNGTTVSAVPNMSCTGQDPVNDPFFTYTMAGTTNYLYPSVTLPNNSQYKCYDSFHNLNQLQPAPYDGLYQFPSQTCLTSATTPTITTPFTAPTFMLPGNAAAYHCATVANPATGQTGAATAILPPGKYVTEVIVPPNWELNKEEDLNLLIGDQYIAPAALQFTGLGAIFITPDQASIDAANPSYTGPYTPSNPYNQPFSNCTAADLASSCTFTPNKTNNGKQAGDYGRTSFGGFITGGIIMQSAPCVGLLRVVPDYLSISPESGEVAPFAGVSKNLCDRREVTLDDQMQAKTDFFIWTKVAKAVTFTGFISDDFSSEFDPASPAFGEKFAVTNVPVSFKDFNGIEVSRIYSDQWGIFNGLVYGSWEVNVPNITGYSPNMMITCMNDPGPIHSIPNDLTSPLITDPFYNPSYSNFCYENPFMPGDAMYMDTPVIPVSAFAEGYNPPDCAYPDGTPMIKSVISNEISGPWVSEAGVAAQTGTLTITALGDQVVPNNAYSGPAANTAPYNQKFITRHYGFGSAPSTCPSSGACPNVTVGGAALWNVGWSDTTITGTVPCATLNNCNFTGTGTPQDVPLCSVQQQGFGGARCGEVVITAANGKQSIDTVTITIGGKAPTTPVPGENSTNDAIQTAIDAAASGDLILVGPGTYDEMLLMWKPVRLQGVGDGSVIVNANAHPAGKILEPWRRKVNCLFGLALNGGFIDNTTPSGGTAKNPYDPNSAFPTQFGTAGECPFYGSGSVTGLLTTQSVVDPAMGEPVVGWDASLNGNIAELLQEPTLMGAYEGAGITVLAKGLENNNTANCTPLNALGCIPLNNSTAVGGDCDSVTPSPFYPSNFLCNPSRIDGITFTNSSQGGGGIFAHGWNHNLEVSNNHSTSNGGTLTGGITIGQMETVDPTLLGVTNASFAQPLGFNTNVHVHNNSVTNNASFGDELNSNTPSSAGGVTMCTGSDNYLFDYNWVCGNLSTGDGGGFAHHGFSWNGHIEHNSFLFNQSINPTVTTYGGGAVIQGAAPDGALGEAGLLFDIDVAPALSDGIGPGLVIDANLFQGNTAEEGSGGGLMLMHVNGNDVLNNPSVSGNWYKVEVTNNIFVNNVAGWTGGGVALYDAVNVEFINNTTVSNDSTSSAGVEFNSLLAPIANHPPPGCDPTANPNCTGFKITTSTPQPAGLATERHSTDLLAAFTDQSVICPAGHDTVPASHACVRFSIPVLANDLFWQNRAFHITVTPPSGGAVTLAPALSQPITGACPAGSGANAASYWDIGVYNDASPTSAGTGNPRLHPTFSILTSGGYGGSGNLVGGGANPHVVSQYCNGSRVTPEIATQLCSGPNGFANAPGCIQPGTVGIQVPAGVPDSLVPPLPLFAITPAATVDEGSNWINMFYGPLSLSNPTSYTTAGTVLPPLGNYAPAFPSVAIGAIPRGSNSFNGAPPNDFFGNPRPDPNNLTTADIGAIEFQFTTAGALSLSPTIVDFVPQAVGTTSPAPGQTITVGNPGTTGSVTITSIAFPPSPFEFIQGTVGAGTCVVSPTPTVLGPGGFCTITVRFAPTAGGLQTGNLVIGSSAGPATVVLNGTGLAPLLTLSAPTIAFGNQLNGTTSAATTVVLSNTGEATAAITYSSLTGTGFIRGGIGTNNCGGTLAVGLSCNINIRFAPPKALPTPPAFNATLTLTVVGTAPPMTVNLGLSGTGFLLFNPTSLAFGPQQVGTSGATQIVTLNNQGATPLTIIAIGLGGTNPGQFVAPNYSNCTTTPITPATPLILAASGSAGSSCTVSEQFHPTTVGDKSANLNFTITGGTNPYSVPLTSGTGIQATVGISAPVPALNTGGLGVKNGVITVTNSGTGPLTMTAAPALRNAANTGAAPAAFTLTTVGTTPCTATTVLAAGGGQCTIGVQYTPPNTALSSARVLLTDTGAAATIQVGATFSAN